MKKLILTLLFSFAFAFADHTFFYKNNAGYDANGPKTLVVRSSNTLKGISYNISKSDSIFLSGTFGDGLTVSNWGSSIYHNIDFSSIKDEGTYFLTFNDGLLDVKEEITIANDLMGNIPLKLVLQYFRKDRSAVTHSNVTIYGSSNTRNVQGGWADASGDYGKYLSHLSYANYLNPQQIPLTVWTLAFVAERIPAKVMSTTNDANFAKDEAVFGADFLIRMLDNAGFFYMTVFNNWGSGSWYLCEFSTADGIKSSNYQTAYREGGGMAIAALARASTLKKDGAFTADQYLSAAKIAFEHLESKQTLGGSCEYCNDGKENIIDDYTALMAANELYNATKETRYLDIARSRATHLSERLSDDGFFFSDNQKERPFWHASDAGLPLVSLIRYLELETDNSKTTPIKQAIKKHLNWLIAVTNRETNPFGYAKQTYKTQGAIRTGYFIPHDNESGYWWQGENARIASLAAAAVYSSRILNYSDSAKAFAYAADQIDWILGKNPYGVSFMQGIGEKNPRVYQNYYQTTFDGGIANGITGLRTDGSGIIWDDYSAAGFSESWQYWRWVEQWLPHSTWFLMALATWYDESPVKIDNSDFIPNNDNENENNNDNKDENEGEKVPDNSTITKSIKSNLVNVTFANNTLQFMSNDSRLMQIKIVNTTGKIIIEKTISCNAAIDVSHLKKGIYIVTLNNILVKKVAIH